MKKLILLLVLSLLVAACGGAPSPQAAEPSSTEKVAEPSQTEEIEEPIPMPEPSTPVLEPTPVISDETSFPFRREVHGDTTIFYGKDGVVMEITPRLVRVEYGRDLEQDITIVVRDPAVGPGDETTIYVYAPSYCDPGIFTDAAHATPYLVHSPGIVQGRHLGFFSRRTADYQRLVNGVDTQTYIAGYGRGRTLYELAEEWVPGSDTTPEPFASSMAGAPKPEVLVEGYWEVEFYIPEPPRDTSLQEEGLVWGALTTVDGGEYYYLVDARERFDEEVCPERDYFIKVWKISKESGEVVAYGAETVLPCSYDPVVQIPLTDGEEFQLPAIR